jgi:ankyrin repeat protein
MAFKDCKDKYENTPAHLAAAYGHLLDDFDYLAFKDCKNDKGYTPADIAERCGHLPGRFANAREAEAFDPSMEENCGPR